VIKIGDFSKLSLVSVRMLRYYEEMGLFQPARVDPFTGYRYYSFDQLPRLNRILALKDLGLTLEQIACLLEGGLPAEQLKGMLVIKQMELQRQLEAEQGRLERVAARLRQIEQEENMSTYEVILKKGEALKVASLRKTIPQPQGVSQMFEELFTGLERAGARPAGAPCAVWHDTEHKEVDWDVEVAVAVAAEFAATDGVRCTQMAAVEKLACTVHPGSYENLPQAYTALMNWIEANGYQLAGPMREFYLRGPGPQPTDPNEYVTEIQVPVESAGA
jgi:DNA-binding transcriptional MerR regulator